MTDRDSKLVPFNLEAEAAVISASILDDTGATLDEVQRICCAEDFYDLKHKLLFATICDLRENGNPTDAVTIANHLNVNGKWSMVGAATLAQILDATPSIANAVSHARIIRALKRVRSAIHYGQETAAHGATMQGADEVAIQGWLESIEQKFADIAHTGQTSTLRPLGEVLVQVQSILSASRQSHSAVSGVATGFTLLDGMTTGMHGGDLWITAGRPGMGKSSLARSMAVKIAGAGEGVVIFSLEMPAEQIGMALVAMQAGIDLMIIRSGKLGVAEWQRATAAIAQLAQLPIWINDTAGISLLEVRAAVRQLQREIAAGQHKHVTSGRIGCAMIDYLQLMGNSGVRNFQSRENEIGELSRGLKAMAKQLDVPVNALSQLNREPEKRNNKIPQLSDLRESGSIEADADTVILLHRPEYYDPEDDAMRGIAQIIVAKQRNGPTGMALVAFHKSTTRFANLEHSDVYDDDVEQTTLFDGFDDGARYGEQRSEE